MLSTIKKNSTNFFIEVVSGLCFGQSSAPEDQLVTMLLDIVFTKQREETNGEESEGGKQGTRNLTPFKDEVGDKQPIVRSFLLQLLLEHEYVIECMMYSEPTLVINSSTEKVKDHLKTYFDRCQQVLVGGMGVDQELSLLCTQCLEVHSTDLDNFCYYYILCCVLCVSRMLLIKNTLVCHWRRRWRQF